MDGVHFFHPVVEEVIDELVAKATILAKRAGLEKSYGKGTKLLGRSSARRLLAETLQEELDGNVFKRLPMLEENGTWKYEEHYVTKHHILELLRNFESYSVSDAFGSEPQRFSQLDVGFRLEIGRLIEKFEIRDKKRG